MGWGIRVCPSGSHGPCPRCGPLRKMDSRVLRNLDRREDVIQHSSRQHQPALSPGAAVKQLGGHNLLYSCQGTRRASRPRVLAEQGRRRSSCAITIEQTPQQSLQPNANETCGIAQFQYLDGAQRGVSPHRESRGYQRGFYCLQVEEDLGQAKATFIVLALLSQPNQGKPAGSPLQAPPSENPLAEGKTKRKRPLASPLR